MFGTMGSEEFIVANRTHGRVDEHDGEYVETEFTHLVWSRIPLLPVRSFWIVNDRGSQRIGFQIQLHPRSVAATYLRIWAPAIATAVMMLSSSALAPVMAVVLFGLSAWSWTWWPRDAAVRRRSDFDLAAFGSRCDPARMTDTMNQILANQLTLRASAGTDPRPPDDIIRFGPRTVDEALLAYGLLRLTEARSPRPQRSPNHLDGAEPRIGNAVRQLRPRGGPYRDRHAASALELWSTLADAAQAGAGDRRAELPRAYDAVPASGLVLPSFVSKPWIGFAVLAVSTALSGIALRCASTPRPAPRLTSGAALARRPIGEYVAVRCDYVQNSPSGKLRRVTLCVVGPHILAVAGGNRLHDNGLLLQGYVEDIPVGWSPSWGDTLRRQIQTDPRYYDFYLRRVSYEDDTPDDPEEDADHRGDDPSDLRSDHRGEGRAHHDDTLEPLLRAAAVAASLATLAGWFVWIRLWQLRRRVATWRVTG